MWDGQVSEHLRQLSDNPSLETQVALVVQALDTYMAHDHQWKERTTTLLDDLVKQVRTQNGNVARLTSRGDDHDRWHGSSDEKIATRVGKLWDEREAALIRKGVYLTWSRVVAWIVGIAGSFGIGGLLIGKLT